MACPMASNAGEMPANHPTTAHSSEKMEEVPIPQPQPRFLVGNLFEMDPDFPSRSVQRMAKTYGEILQLQLPGRRIIVVSSQRLADEVCDQERFFKEPSRVLRELRPLTGDGLFTSAHKDGRAMKREENWWKAHRLLVPAFGPLGLRKMAEDMIDISAQMMLRWDRLGENHLIDCSDDFTRLAFDTIGLCSFGYRFNEFYSDEAHPFATQMADVLKMSGRRTNRTEFQNWLHRWEEQDRQEKVASMLELVDQIVEERKAHPKPVAKDLLNTMLYSVDRESGETLTKENVAFNMVTFLVAGHETTSGTLSFLWYNLLKNPEAFHKAQKQVDEVVGDHVLSVEMLPKLTYIDACIKETLRLNSPIPLFSVIPTDDTLLGGKYRIEKSDAITVNLAGVHNDPAAWGPDHGEFRPERFLDGKFQNLPSSSWKPFGNGLRACIGRGFAEQEMLLNTAMILQRFSPEMADPGYDLEIKSTLTIKPEGFYMRVRRRPGKSLLTGIPGGVPSKADHKQAADEKSEAAAGVGAKEKQKSVSIFFGGNSGTCEGFSQALATSLSERGIQAEISNLDSAAENLSKDTTNFIITASYEGQPPDNAKKFVSWLQTLEGSDTLKDVKYSVMGVGNSDWASTFHRIPKLIDEKMGAVGAEAVLPAGFTNVKADLIGPFEDWSDAVVKTLTAAGGSPMQDEKPTLKVSVERSSVAKQLGEEKMGTGIVLKNEQLADTSVGLEKRHMDVRLPHGMNYKSGDYLVVAPRNPEEAVHRVMRYFGYDEQTKISVTGSKKTFLPSTPTPVEAFLRDYVELGFPVTKRQLKIIAGYAKDHSADHLLKDEVGDKLSEKRYSIVDVLIENHVSLPFDVYIDMLLPLTPRQYSISSSPLAEGHEDIVSLTYDVHSAPALSGHGIFEGACSTFLSGRKPGDAVSCFVRQTNVGFRLPGDPQTPIMMFCAGTGIAPMRAFLQERAAIAEAGSRKLGPALLFFGSRDAEKDYLYRSELLEWEKLGIVTLYPAHSRMPDSGTEGHPKYVQDAIYEHREECAKLFTEENQGRIYVCGSAAKLGQSCANVCKQIYSERMGKDEEEAEAWLQRVRTSRYVSDVY
ncbi:uncharacterized protein LTR77_008127 [Saxophila tyrrhenica]|uniref:Bifunctional cytochrome P450/NADPH--P450 reductase n=1 Tax=Saxophila tyrrhenica TaxID=1690608 RepID=A0AAV9P5Y0_9PEZI|nr:hypothetical protein LTR77_008127 [Saxophila tyrrhenica]